MNLFLPPKKAAYVLGMNERTLRERIRRGAIEHVVDNGCTGSSVRHFIDMTREFGITREDYDEWIAGRAAEAGARG